MAKNKKNICLVTTVYSFFLYLMVNGYNEDDIYIFTAWFPKEISKNVKHIQMPAVIFRGKKFAELNSLSGIYKNIVGFLGYFYGYLKLRILLFIKTFNCDVEVYGHAQTPFSYMFFENENSNIIEDGMENYTAKICETHKINPLIDFILHICGIYFLNQCECYGSHKNIKNVYLTNEHDNPLIKDKVQIINIKERWNNLSKSEQEKLLEIFNVNIEGIDFNEKTALLLTQPLSESTSINITEEEELNIYKEIMAKFSDYQIILKPHPRDTKDFEKLFPDVKIIDGSFPVEIMTMINIYPTVVCSVVTTALYNFEKSKIYVYDGKLNDERISNAREELIKIIKEKNLDLIN
ncbi:polysialyltransferase family glycosyltransferase [Methanobrevibacter sp.]|uniref:polysialyltransferase family glycosyltransferase n=1 Tax=Methanobrevibacter sp. TaxID=66852 RepID=UPI00388D4A5A